MYAKGKLSDTQQVARLICRLTTGDCCMDETTKQSCTMTNCRIMVIAMAALVKAGRNIGRKSKLQRPKPRPSFSR